MALEGRDHELALSLRPGSDLERVRGEVTALLPDTAVARTWRELVPDLVQLLEVSGASMVIIYLIVFALIALGLLNTQRMSAFWRRRELGVLVAIGTTPSRLATQLVAEGVNLSVLGALIGAGLGVPIVSFRGAVGFDMGAFGSGDTSLSFMGTSFDDRLCCRVDPEALVPPVVPFRLARPGAHRPRPSGGPPQGRSRRVRRRGAERPRWSWPRRPLSACAAAAGGSGPSSPSLSVACSWDRSISSPAPRSRSLTTRTATASSSGATPAR